MTFRCKNTKCRRSYVINGRGLADEHYCSGLCRLKAHPDYKRIQRERQHAAAEARKARIRNLRRARKAVKR